MYLLVFIENSAVSMYLLPRVCSSVIRGASQQIPHAGQGLPFVVGYREPPSWVELKRKTVTLSATSAETGKMRFVERALNELILFKVILRYDMIAGEVGFNYRRVRMPPAFSKQWSYLHTPDPRDCRYTTAVATCNFQHLIIRVTRVHSCRMHTRFDAVCPAQAGSRCYPPFI